MKKVVIILFGVLGLVSCDCVQQTYGVVVDEKSLQPLDSVFFSKVRQRPSSVYLTDTNGTFTFDGISGGLFGCPAIELKFTKPGYEELIVTMEDKYWNYEDTIQYTKGDTLKLKIIEE